MPEDLKAQILAIVKTNISGPGLFNDTLDQVVIPRVMEAVKNSENKIDDVLAGALLPLLTSEIKKAVKEAWDALLAQPGAPVGDIV